MKNLIKLVHGVGVNDADYTVRTKDGLCHFYSRWADMIARCYYEKSLEKHPTYRCCTVCDEWLTFSNFKMWMEKQDWQGKELDKDIKKPGNKVYSPDNCMFVTRRENTDALVQPIRSTNSSGIKGVGFFKALGKWRARIKIDGKDIHLGYFDKIEDASKARTNKETEIKKEKHRE